MPKKRANKANTEKVLIAEDNENMEKVTTEKRERIMAFLKQFDIDVDKHCMALQSEANMRCTAIKTFTTKLILSLPEEKVNKTWKEILEQDTEEDNLKELRDVGSESEPIEDYSAAALETADTVASSLKPLSTRSGRKTRPRAPYRTPAAGKGKLAPWTDTPVITPQFDKRLMHMDGGKPK